MEKVVIVFKQAYKSKRVLVTGHTGFKGSWLTQWLLSLGAEVTGYSLYIPSQPANFEVLGLEDKINHVIGDIRDHELLSQTFKEFEPEIVFHLAAQPLVRQSYEEPKLTFDTNLGGVVNVMEAIRATPSVQAAVIITSDKCYENVEWPYGYRESDHLGGKDPYSASKACAEIAARSYILSFFNTPNSAKIATTRAGNVIGGGDWAADRIVADCMRSWSQNESCFIRNPNATRPWQHVLEPLSGYLWLGTCLLDSEFELSGEAFNFGPDASVNQPVAALVSAMQNVWTDSEWSQPEDIVSDKKEANLLKLDCSKALHYLSWLPTLEFTQAVEMTAQWYKQYYGQNMNMLDYTNQQIAHYEKLATEKSRVWTQI